jgi:predicted aspartyl protease
MSNKLNFLVFKSSGLLLIIGLFGTACEHQKVVIPNPSNTPTSAVIISPSPIIHAPTPTPNTSLTQPNDGDVYQAALTKAEAANTIAQSATSKDDWLLVASNLQTSIAMLKSISVASSQYIHAAKILPKYERQLMIAQQKSINFVPRSSSQISKLVTSPTSLAANQNSDLFSLPIEQKLGGIPVVAVTFNHKHKFLMLLDTGASRTLITQRMFEQMKLKSVGTSKAKTANGIGSFSLAQIDRVQFGSGVTNSVLVAIGDNTLNYGLLGHDVYDGYDMTIKEHSIEFRKR